MFESQKKDTKGSSVTKRSSNTLLCLVSFFATQMLLVQQVQKPVDLQRRHILRLLVLLKLADFETDNYIS